jgi:hypothetical protein
VIARRGTRAVARCITSWEYNQQLTILIESLVVDAAILSEKLSMKFAKRFEISRSLWEKFDAKILAHASEDHV